MTIETAVARLRKRLGDAITTNDALRTEHGQSESYYQVTPPDAVAFPRSTQDVSDIVRICAAEGCPIVPFGAGTSLEGNTLAIRGGVSLDFRDMAAVLDVHEADLDVVVQPGLTHRALNEELRATGLFFPVDPGANATLGGMAATRASGTTAVRYGTMRENVMALEAVMADGTIIRTGSRARKSAAGYDLTKLLVGSEGTLGIITELTLRLQGQPEATSAALCRFEHFRGAVDTVIQTIQMGIPMARMEFVDDLTVRGFNIHSGAGMVEAPHLMLEFHGSEAAVREQAETVAEIAAENGGSDFEWSTHAEDRNRLWRIRHNAHYAYKTLRPGAGVISTDICVPISRLADAVEQTAADIAETPIMGPILGHVGDGNFHTGLLIDPNNPEELRIGKDLTARMNQRALDMGGTVSGEHGIGIGKMAYMEAEHGAGWQVMAAIKRALDPENILNPGKVVQVN